MLHRPSVAATAGESGAISATLLEAKTTVGLSARSVTMERRKRIMKMIVIS